MLHTLVKGQPLLLLIVASVWTIYNSRNGVHNFLIHGLDCGDEAAEWISNFLGKPFRIMKFSNSLPLRKQNRDVSVLKREWSKSFETETVSLYITNPTKPFQLAVCRP